MNKVLILEKTGFFYVNVEKKQGLTTLSGFEKYGFEERPLFERKGTELLIDCEYLTQLLNLLEKKQKDKNREINIVLPYAMTWYYTLDVEDVPKNRNELYDFVMWKIGKIIPIPKEQIEMRVDVISRLKEQTTLLIAIAFKTFIIDLEKCLRESGFVAPVIMPPSIAILNVLEPYLTEDCTIVWLKEKGFSMMIYIDGMPKYIRELDQTLPVERLDSEIFSFLSTVGKNENIKTPERLLYFDELGREGIKNFLPEKSISVSLAELKIQENVKHNMINKYIIAAGAVS